MRTYKGFIIVMTTAILMIAATGQSIFRDLSAEAQARPVFPHTFFGSVTIAEEPAPSGFLIEARIANVNYAQSIADDQVFNNPTTDGNGGTYGLDSEFRVCADDPNSTDDLEGGITGDSIVFFVRVGSSWFEAETSIDPVVFQERGQSRVDLSVPGDAAPAIPSRSTSTPCGLPEIAIETPRSGGGRGSSNSGGRRQASEEQTMTPSPTVTASSTPVPTAEPTSTPILVSFTNTPTAEPPKNDTATPSPIVPKENEVVPIHTPTASVTPTAVLLAEHRPSPKEIIETGTIEEAVYVIEHSGKGEWGKLLQNVDFPRSGTVLSRLSPNKAIEVIQSMTERQAVDTLPWVSHEAFSKLPTQDLLESLPGIPADILIMDISPTVDFMRNRPRSVQHPPNAVKFMVPRADAYQWVRLTGARNNMKGILAKFSNDSAGLTVTKEDFIEMPSTAAQLRSDQIFYSGFHIDIDGNERLDPVSGYVTFAVDSSWTESNSVHKWSIELNRFDENYGAWVPSPARIIYEDEERTLYRAVVPEFSTFVVTGGREPLESFVESTDLTISSTLNAADQPVLLAANMKNIGPKPVIHVANLWVNNTIEESRSIKIESGQTITVGFLVRKSQGNYIVRIDRLSGNFTVVPRPDILLAQSTPAAVPAGAEYIDDQETATPIPPLVLPPPPEGEGDYLVAIVVGTLLVAVLGFFFVQAIRRRSQ